MTELEQLRKEVNELRERVARIEALTCPRVVPPMQPNYLQPPFKLTCGGTP